MKDSVFYRKHTLRFGGKILSLDTPLVMGILNMTPDSFFSGNRIASEKELVNKAASMLADGAAILDLGGYSSRPGAEHIPEEEELKRLIPAIKLLSSEFPEAILSADTFRAAVAEQAVAAGAGMVNDISAGQLDERMFTAVAALKVPYVAMHMKGTPQTMASEAQYEALLPEVMSYFREKIFLLKELGVTDIIIDPGFGFAKTKEHSFHLLNFLESFKTLQCPVLAGLSRKSLICKTLGVSPQEALNGTTVVNTIAILKGASILRVHDVKEAMEIIKLTCKMQYNSLVSDGA